MADESIIQNFSENPEPQKDGLLKDDITHPQVPQTLPDRLPMSLDERLACCRRHLSKIRYTIKLNWFVSPTCTSRYPEIAE